MAMADRRPPPDLDRDLSEAEARLARQAALVAQLAAKGLDTTLAEAVLGVQESELHALLLQRTIAPERTNHYPAPTSALDTSAGKPEAA